MWYCEVCKKGININTKSSQIKSITDTENEVFSKMKINFTDKTDTYLNPDFVQVDGSVKRAINDCTK